VFDNSYVLRDAGAIRVPDAAGFDPGNELAVAPQQLAFAQPIQPQQAGYIYVWACQPKLQRRLVSNETQGSKVWFDDVKVTHTYSRVTQASDYYAFGSVMREQKSPDDLVYRYGYQGEYSERDLETGWNHFELREFDGFIGRTLTPDPAGQFWSSYLWVGNNPINTLDPTGGKAIDDFIFDSRGNYLRTENIGDPNHRIIIEGANGNKVLNFHDMDFDISIMRDMISQYGGKMPFLFTMDTESISEFILNAGEDPQSIIRIPDIARLYKEGHVGGDFDFSGTQLLSFSLSKGISSGDIANERGGFFAVGNKAYNYFDFGNFLTASAMKAHGTPLWAIKLGGQIHHIKEMTLYKGMGFFDSKADQRALEDGFNYIVPLNFNR
jgi:RHS repeat-associated protein